MRNIFRYRTVDCEDFAGIGRESSDSASILLTIPFKRKVRGSVTGRRWPRGSQFRIIGTRFERPGLEKMQSRIEKMRVARYRDWVDGKRGPVNGNTSRSTGIDLVVD